MITLVKCASIVCCNCRIFCNRHCSLRSDHGRESRDFAYCDDFQLNVTISLSPIYRKTTFHSYWPRFTSSVTIWTDPRSSSLCPTNRQSIPHSSVNVVEFVGEANEAVPALICQDIAVYLIHDPDYSWLCSKITIHSAIHLTHSCSSTLKTIFPTVLETTKHRWVTCSLTCHSPSLMIISSQRLSERRWPSLERDPLLAVLWDLYRLERILHSIDCGIKDDPVKTQMWIFPSWWRLTWLRQQYDLDDLWKKRRQSR